MGIEVIQPGMFTTVQDLGRFGYQRHGVIVGGAMDGGAMRTANLLVGNAEDEAVIEVTWKGPTLLFHEDLLVAVCGGEFALSIGGKPVASNRPVWIKKGSVLDMGRAQSGFRAYLAVAGGWDVPQVLGSRSTNFLAGFGGYKGRLLREGDRLGSKSPGDFSRFLLQRIASQGDSTSFSEADWYVPPQHSPFAQRTAVRVIRGEQFDDFTLESRRQFFQEAYQITPQSDRMGYRLSGPKLELTKQMELLSSAVSAGTIQVPPNGQPIILLADRQTTGGYPKIGHVATVDLPVLAQMRPGETVRFQEISLGEAQQALYRREMALKQIKLGIELNAGWR